MPPAVLGSTHQTLREAAAAGRGALPDEASQGAPAFAFQVRQGQQAHRGAQASPEQQDPAAFDARGLQVMNHPDDIPGFHGSESDGGGGPASPQGIIPPAVGEDGRIETGKPLEGGAGAPAIVAKAVEQEHDARRWGGAGEAPELQAIHLLAAPRASWIAVPALGQFPVGRLHPGQGLGPVEGGSTSSQATARVFQAMNPPRPSNGSRLRDSQPPRLTSSPW